MNEGFSFPEAGAGAGPGGDGDGEGADRLQAVMALATADIGPVRVDPARLRRAQRRHRLAEGGVVAGVLSVALVAATIALHGGGGAKTSVATGPTTTGPTKTAPTSTTAPPSNLIAPVAVSVYDSDDGSEGKAMAGSVLSGTGAWQTNQYCQSLATVGGRHKNTGLVFDLGTATRPTSVTVSVGTPGADLEMWAADPSTTAMPVVRPGGPPLGFTKVASATDVGSTVVFAPAQPVTTRFVLVWFTTLPAVPNRVVPSIHCAHSDGHLYADSITAVRFTRG